MATPNSVLYVELVMSVDRLHQSAEKAGAREGEWPPSVVVAHVGDVDEQVWTPRLMQMVAAFDAGAPPPELTWWEPDADATLERYAAWSLDDAAARTMRTRIALLTALRELRDDQWGATALHEVFGVLDVQELVLRVLAHDEEHRGSLVLPR